MPAEEKTCRSCGRRISWRKKWERDWESVVYCSTACRRRGVDDEDRQIEDLIRRLVGRAPRGVTDVEVLGALGPQGAAGPPSGDRRRPADGSVTRQEAVRRAARRLVAADELEMLQGGQVVDPSRATGPVLLRRRR